MEMSFASQISISAQQDPRPPTPALASLLELSHPSEFALDLLAVVMSPGLSSTYHTVDELHITGALAVAVTSAVLGTGVVALVLGKAAIGIHGDEVQGAIEATADAGDIDVKGELVAQKSESLIRLVVFKQVETAADVGAVLALGDKLEAEGVAARNGTIGSLVLGTVKTALGGTYLTASADALVPGVAIIAVRLVRELMSPSPVGIDDNRALDSVAGAGSALRPGQ